MVNKTPLRLIAIEERPPAEPAEDEQSAAPTRITPDNEAITRKVPNSATIAADEMVTPAGNGIWHRRRVVLAGAVAAVAITTIVLVVAVKGRHKATPAPANTSSVEASAQPTRAPAPTPAPTGAVATESKAAPQIIRLRITAEPVEAELSLDGNVLAGHRLNLEVPKDRGIHVVSASASGYIPFNQQVSFSDDVVLNISLRRDRTPVARQVARPRPSRVEARAPSAVKTPAAQTGTSMEPGMDLGGPTTRSNVKSIDERNPYKP